LVALEYATINGFNDKVSYLKLKVDEWRQRFIDYFTQRGEIKVKFIPKNYNFE
jgi:hypothetical protein